jgi:hypothetical protein
LLISRTRERLDDTEVGIGDRVQMDDVFNDDEDDTDEGNEKAKSDSNP